MNVASAMPLVMSGMRKMCGTPTKGMLTLPMRLPTRVAIPKAEPKVLLTSPARPGLNCCA